MRDRHGDQTSLAEFSGYLANYYFDPDRLRVLESLLDGLTPYGHTALGQFEGSPHRMRSADGMRLLEALISSGEILRLLETTESLSWNPLSAVKGATDKLAESFGPASAAPMWLYPHIPKAGGNTFRVLAHEIFGPTLLDVPWPGNALLVTPWRVLTARCVTGHGAGALEHMGLMGRTSRHVVSVRDPLHRTVSWWLQDILPTRAVEDGSSQGLARDMADWAEEAFTLGAVEIADLTNAQARWLVYPPPASSTGWPWFGEAAPVWETSEQLEVDLAPKVEAYLRDCALMGLPEDVGAMVAVIAREEGVDHEITPDVRANSSRHSASDIAAALPPSIVASFEGILRLDRMVYEEALVRRGEFLD